MLEGYVQEKWKQEWWVEGVCLKWKLGNYLKNNSILCKWTGWAFFVRKNQQLDIEFEKLEGFAWGVDSVFSKILLQTLYILIKSVNLKRV